jgi:hypothetical protein
LRIIKDGGSAYREGANYINNPSHPSTVIENAITVSKIFRYRISGSTPIIDTGVNNAGYTEIDNKQYVDTTTGQLAPVGGAYWSIQRIFWIPNSPTNAFIVYYGNDRYRSLVDATNAKDNEPFIEAPNTAQNAIFIGHIIIQGGGSGTPARDLLNANEATIIPAGLFRNVGGVGSSGTTPVSTTLNSLADVALVSTASGDLLVYGNGSQWNNSKTLNGTYTISGSLNVTTNLNATASWANNSLTSSYITGSIFSGSNSALSASYALTASYALNSTTIDTSTFATTGSNTFKSNQIISGTLETTDRVIVKHYPGGFVHATEDYIPGSSGSILYTSVGAQTGDTFVEIAVRQGGGALSSGVLALNSNGGGTVTIGKSTTGTDLILDIKGNTALTGSLLVTGSSTLLGNQIISGSLTTTGSVKFTNLTTSSQQWVLTYDSASGQLYYTASSALGGGGTNISVNDEGNNL